MARAARMVPGVPVDREAAQETGRVSRAASPSADPAQLARSRDDARIGRLLQHDDVGRRRADDRGERLSRPVPPYSDVVAEEPQSRASRRRPP